MSGRQGGEAAKHRTSNIELRTSKAADSGRAESHDLGKLAAKHRRHSHRQPGKVVGIVEPTPARVAARRKLTAAIQAAIEAGVERGLSPSAAGRELGLKPQTISAWRAQFPAFRDGIEGARRRGLMARLKEIGGVHLVG